MAREYSAKVIVSLSSVKQIQKAQQSMYDQGIIDLNSNKLTQSLSTVAAVLGLIFVTSTPAGLAAGVVSLASSMVSSARDSLKFLVYEGFWQLSYTQRYLEENPKYDLIEIELPFIEYVVGDKTIRFITGKGLVTKVHSNSGWIVL